MRKFHDLVSRIDKALAEPAVFIEDPAKAALLSSQRGELERILVAAEEEWLRLAGDLDAAREGQPTRTGGENLVTPQFEDFPEPQCKQKQQRQQNQKRENPGFCRKCPHLRARGLGSARGRRAPANQARPARDRPPRLSCRYR